MINAIGSGGNSFSSLASISLRRGKAIKATVENLARLSTNFKYGPDFVLLQVGSNSLILRRHLPLWILLFV